MADEAKDIFEAMSHSLKELLSVNGLGMYIPAYQRPYGWDKGKVTTILDDAMHGLNMLLKRKDSYTFLGSIITIHDIHNLTVQPIVKEEVPGKVLTVIDGQQRICSLALLTIALHNHTEIIHWRLFKGKPPEDDEAMMWINGQTLNILRDLKACFFERQTYGDAPVYPRIIRAFTDQWSRKLKQARYRSPIANLIYAYASQLSEDHKKPTDYRPARRHAEDSDTDLAGEADLVRRYAEIRHDLLNLMKNIDNEEIESAPSLARVSVSPDFQKALFNHEFSDPIVAATKNPPSEGFAELLRLLIISSYVLNRIALTVVKGKNEDYAFTIFESLNTTGEPLTAFETFKPRVVWAEGLGDYGDSLARSYVDEVDSYLSQFNAGRQLQNATSDLIVSFALAETGEKLSKRLSDQRNYLKNEFGRYQSSPTLRNEFLRYIRNCVAFVGESWDVRQEDPVLSGIAPSLTTDTTKLCLAFLRQLNHTVALGPLIRLYSAARDADGAEREARVAEIEVAVKAVTAFSVIWRASRRTTANIDRQYREIMSGVDNTVIHGPFARSYPASESNLSPATPDAEALRAELHKRLTVGEGAVPGKQQWIQIAKSVPIYQVNRALSRILLLAAYHDSLADEATPGLIRRGKPGCSPCLTLTGWRDEQHLSLEHIAPRRETTGWNFNLYSDKEVVHRLGNLLLVQDIVNSSLSARPWPEKRALYSALGAQTVDDAREILKQAKQDGATFGESVDALATASRYMPHLAAVGQRDGDWDVSFIDQRCERLLSLAWDRFWPWLTG